MYMTTREDEVAFLKKLWTDEPVKCPKCQKATLTHLHRKAKKSNCEWKCPSCGEIYRTVRMLKELPE
ncbi:MAG: hypothetical protein IKL92_00815 [Oscillospiraceae bacterium]|nr:hypothetical protein [Oscillospiraceae bacterium]